MANSILNPESANQELTRFPAWHVYDVSIDTTATPLDVRDLPENTVILDSFIACYQAEAGATSTKADIETSDGTTDVVVNTAASDNLGAVGRAAGTAVPKVVIPASVAGAQQRLRVQPTISGTATTAALARVCVLMYRADY